MNTSSPLRRVVVTGASGGLGLAATRGLARRGIAVVLAVRDPARGAAARRDLLAELPAADLDVRRLDLADLDSVRAFADALSADGRPVDALLNNAGIGDARGALSPQGHDLVFATNHLGHFALTGLLLPGLAASTDPRVVTVSSGFYPMGRIDFDRLTSYPRGRAYTDSKLANTLFGVELERRLRAAGSPVRSLLAHPGVAPTAMPTGSPSVAARAVGRVLLLLQGRSVEAGAAPLVHALVADLPGGTMVGPGPRRGPVRPRVEPIRRPADDAELARRLWEVSAELTGVHPAIPTRQARRS